MEDLLRKLNALVVETFAADLGSNIDRIAGATISIGGRGLLASGGA